MAREPTLGSTAVNRGRGEQSWAQVQVMPGAGAGVGAHLGVAGVGGAAPVQGDPGPRVVGVQAAEAGVSAGPGAALGHDTT